MAEKLLQLKRPKYHPVTGVELDSAFDIEFDSSADKERIQELYLEVEQLKTNNLELRSTNRFLGERVKRLEDELVWMSSKSASDLRDYQAARWIRQIRKTLRHNRSKIK